MSDDLPDQNNPNLGETNPSTSSSPPNPSNNNVDPVQSWVAQHEQRDSSGRFAKTDHLTNPDSIGTNGQPSPNSPNTPNHPNIPLPVSFTQNNKYSEKNDPPLVSVSVTNPITYLKLFIKRLLRNEGITIKIKPLTAIFLIAALSASFGTGFNVAKMFFPTSSPILHRAITLQGTIQKSETGQYYLSLPDGSFWKLNLINLTTQSSLSNLNSKQVLVKGNMTAENNVIEVKEVIAFDRPTPIIYNPIPQPATNSAQPSL